MQACVNLTFFVLESQRHDGHVLYQWLLREASTLGLPGGSAFRAIAGYGRPSRAPRSAFLRVGRRVAD
jgi:PII-like signaling protein